MTTTENVVYTAKVHTTGGRAGGSSVSSDGRLDIKHSLPGTPGTGTNPEQLFAAGWSTCFESAIGIEARKKRITLPSDLAIDAEVDLCKGDDGTHYLRARLNVSLPGVEHDIAQELVHVAEETCPYSKAIRGNVEVEIKLV